MKNIMKELIEMESVEDVLSVLTLSKTLPEIDNIYTRYRFDVIANQTVFNVLKELIQKGVLTQGKNGKMEKGPNWSPPKFIIDKKYNFK